MKSNNMEVEICRVCLETSESMVNIFDGIPNKSISIADMISQCTGLRVFRGDSFPKTVCPTCKQDATNAYEIKQLYETSHRVFCQMKTDFQGGQDLLEQEVCEISDTEGTEKEELERVHIHGQVKNEPIEEDIFEEDHLRSSDCDVDQFDFQVKIEETDDQFNEDNFYQEDKAKHPRKDIKRPHCCSHCHKSFPSDSILKVHIRTHNKERPYRCSYCEKTFSQNGNLKLHIRTHTGERPYKCPHCELACARNGTLQKHIRTHTGERPYKCPHCEMTFSHIAPRQQHIRTHTGERPYKCSYCQKSFSQQGHLQDHIRSHTGERPFKCSLCQSSFALRCSLRKHIRTHTGDRPYKCSQKSCKKSFTRKNSLVEHEQTHTGERPYKCAHCERGFTLNRYLQLHIRIHTK